MTDDQPGWVPPFRVVPADQESLRGLLLRYCDAHAWPNLRHFCTLFGTKPSAVKNGQDVAAIAKALGLPEEELRALAPQPISGRVMQYFGHKLPKASLEVRRKACPECVRGNGHFRWWWEIRYFHACPEHGLALVDRCSCGNPLTWDDASKFRCAKCTAKGKRTELESIPAQIGSFERWCLYRLLSGGEEWEAAKLLGGNDIVAVTALVEAIAVLQDRGFAAHQPVSFDVLPDMAKRRDRAFNLIKAEDFDPLIDRLFKEYKAAGHASLPIVPADILGWFAAHFGMVIPAFYPELNKALATSFGNVLRLPIKDIFKAEFLPLAPLALRLGVPVDVAFDWIRLQDKGDLLIQHEIGPVIAFDLVDDLRSAFRSRLRV